MPVAPDSISKDKNKTKTQNMSLWKTFNIQTIAKTKETFSVQTEKTKAEVIHQLCLRIHFSTDMTGLSHVLPQHT